MSFRLISCNVSTSYPGFLSFLIIERRRRKNDYFSAVFQISKRRKTLGTRLAMSPWRNLCSLLLEKEIDIVIKMGDRLYFYISNCDECLQRINEYLFLYQKSPEKPNKTNERTNKTKPNQTKPNKRTQKLTTLLFYEY